METSIDEKAAILEKSRHANDEKKEAILEACRTRDLDALTALAESRGGFLTDSLRQQACKYLVHTVLHTRAPCPSEHQLTPTPGPILLGIPPDHDKAEPGPDGSASAPSWESLPHHKDEDQVQLDVNRAFIYYPDSTSFPLNSNPPLLHSQPD